MMNPKYLEIDNIFYSTLIIINYNREHDDLILKDIIDSNINLNISIIYEKQNTYKVIKDLTYHIGNVGVDLQSYSENRQDIDIAAFTYNDAKYIRREMQLNNEDLYYLYVYVNIFSQSKKDLEYMLNKVEGILQSRGMQTRRAYFRQEQAFKMCLPFFCDIKEVKNVAKRNILTSGLLATYPFITSTVCDEDGIFIGSNMNNNSLVFIDKYNNNKYKNSNMCIFGTSGAGKSYYTKLLILRYRLLGIEQYVIDPEREYEKLCENLEGVLLKIGPNSNTYINVFDIREESLEDNQSGYLATKIGKLIGFFNLVFGNINEEEKSIIEEKLIETYKRKGINFDDETLYKENDRDKINIKRKFKETQDMPILEDFYNILAEDKKTEKLRIKLIPFIKGSLKFFNNYTNIKLNNKLIIADIYELGEDGRLLEMQLEELIGDLEVEELLMVKDYLVPTKRKKPEVVLEEIKKLSREDLMKSQTVAKLLGYGDFDNYDEVGVYTKGYRVLNKIPRMPSSIVENLVKSFKSFQHILAADIPQLDEVDGIGEVRAEAIKQYLRKMQEQFAFDNLV